MKFHYFPGRLSLTLKKMSFKYFEQYNANLHCDIQKNISNLDNLMYRTNFVQ
jgi:hypothetical protein